MDEYISREEAINAIKSLESSMPAKDNYAKGYDAALGRVLIAVREVPPTADVQPVNRWISVKDRLPNEDGWYLVCKHNRVRVAEWCKDCWYNESDLPIDDCTITYWQPLPEPPKGGDTSE